MSLRLFSSFDVGKQGSSITKNKAPLVTMLMFSNQGESKLPGTTFTLTMLLPYQFTFVYCKLTLSVLHTHLKSFLPYLINFVRLLRAGFELTFKSSIMINTYKTSLVLVSPKCTPWLAMRHRKCWKFACYTL